jgi:DnaJ like chaperone protein
MIHHVSQLFGLSDAQFNGIVEGRKSSDKLNPYVVLESKPDDNLTDIRKRYLKLSKEHHPDLLLSKGVPEEVIVESKKKMRTINSAWDEIQKLKKN